MLGVLVSVPVVGAPVLVPVVLGSGLPLLPADNFPMSAIVTVIACAVLGRAVLTVMLFSTAIAAGVDTLGDFVNLWLLPAGNEFELCPRRFPVMGFFYEVLQAKVFGERFNPQGFVRPDLKQVV